MRENHSGEQLRQFTTRIPTSIFSMIADRAATNHRDVNAEIIILLEEALDRKVALDQDHIRSLPV